MGLPLGKPISFYSSAARNYISLILITWQTRDDCLQYLIT